MYSKAYTEILAVLAGSKYDRGLSDEGDRHLQRGLDSGPPTAQRLTPSLGASLTALDEAAIVVYRNG